MVKGKVGSMKKKMALKIFSLLTLFSCMLTAAAIVDQSGCERSCGNITVPYPFGLDKPECSKDSSFNLTCDTTSAPPKLHIDGATMLNISLENGTAVIEVGIAYGCYDESGLAESLSLNATMGDRPFRFSTRNKFTVIGCDTIGVFGDGYRIRFSTGCLSLCSSNNIDELENPFNFTEELVACEGIGCCQTSVPKELDTLYIGVDSLRNHSTQLKTNPCSFAFLSDPSWYVDVAKFSLSDMPEKHISSPVLLDWAIRGNSCVEAKGSEGDYICNRHADCIDSPNTPGYLCSCKEGFKGNPYANDETGCQDIDECKEDEDRGKYPCHGKCKNTPGNYTCDCSFGHHGDGKVGCSLSTASKIAIGIGATVLFAIFVLFLLCLHKKKIREVRLSHTKLEHELQST